MAISKIHVIKFVHSVIFLFMSFCIGLVLYSATMDQITALTWLAFGLIIGEGVVLWVNDWQCPLTTYAERLGATRGAVTDIFLPKWLADRVFTICGVVSSITTAILLLRLLT